MRQSFEKQYTINNARVMQKSTFGRSFQVHFADNENLSHALETDLVSIKMLAQNNILTLHKTS